MEPIKLSPRWARWFKRHTEAVESRLVKTFTVTRPAANGQMVEVTVAKKRGYNRLAFYKDGTGPFYTNRAQRRANGA